MNKEHIKGIKDKPLSGRNEDKLGITSSAKALTEFIDTCQTPMTIGIQGSWGTGKTSILNMMKERMEDKNPSYEHVWVNAWEHSLLSKPEETLFKIVNNRGNQKLLNIIQITAQPRPLNIAYDLIS